MTPLDHLPSLAADTFTPATFDRLLEHLTKAIQAVTDRWSAELSRATANVTSAPELARILVAQRPILARRLQIASHPCLPQQLRDALMQSCRADIARYQREFESALMHSSEVARVDLVARDKLAGVVRENSFLAVFDYDIAQDGKRATVKALPEQATSDLPTRPAARRRVTIFTQDSVQGASSNAQHD